MQVYLSRDEILLKNHGYGFTGSKTPDPSQGLTTPVTVDEKLYEITYHGNMVVFRKKGWRSSKQEQEDYRAYLEAAGIPAHLRQGI